MKIIQFYKGLDKDTRHKIDAFLWTTFNGIVGIIITYLSGLDFSALVVIIPVINLITKETNKHFNPNYGK